MSVPADPSAETFFAVGLEFFRDAERQIRMADGVVTNTAYLLTGFALELILKSYIVHAGIKKAGDATLYTHNLRTLWEWAATAHESPCSTLIPDRVDPVHTFHANFLGRYRPPDASAFAVQGSGHREEMAKLVERVREQLAVR